MGRPLRVLVTGASGQLGSDVVRCCTTAGDEVLGLNHRELDVSDRDGAGAAVSSWRPDVVVHCAAWTAVDACESDPDRAFAVNALGARWVAEACRRFGAHLVNVSTDYVFDGTKAAPYHEWDEPNPLGVYGASKLGGEREVTASGAIATTVRTSWVCGAAGPNMVKTILRLLAGDGPLRFVDDQRGHPSFTEDLAGMIRRLAVERRTGLHHVTNQGAVTWFEFARSVAAAAGADPSRIEPISTVELAPPRAAARPANSVLDNAALRAAGVPLLNHFEVPLARLVGTLRRE
jgi:dTDP-4-dehydrorhamnose reductase